MAAKPYTAVATAAGTASLTISPDKSGIQWTIAQLGFETQPFRATAQCTVRLNGNYLTSTAVAPASTSGQPAVNLQATDKLTFDFVGMTAGDTAIITAYYNESAWGTIPRADVV